MKSGKKKKLSKKKKKRTEAINIYNERKKKEKQKKKRKDNRNTEKNTEKTSKIEVPCTRGVEEMCTSGKKGTLCGHKLPKKKKK